MLGGIVAGSCAGFSFQRQADRRGLVRRAQGSETMGSGSGRVETSINMVMGAGMMRSA